MLACISPSVSSRCIPFPILIYYIYCDTDCFEMHSTAFYGIYGCWEAAIKMSCGSCSWKKPGPLDKPCRASWARWFCPTWLWGDIQLSSISGQNH